MTLLTLDLADTCTYVLIREVSSLCEVQEIPLILSSSSPKVVNFNGRSDVYPVQSKLHVKQFHSHFKRFKL